MQSDQCYFKHGREEMLPFVPERRSRVLEIGCGEGRFCASLTGVQETWGIEPSAAADVANTRLNRVLHGTFDDVKSELPLRYFDVVVCNDVIEHMPDHEKFLSEIGNYIAPGGLIIGSIPNARFYETMFEYLFEKDWRYRDAGILDRTHLAFFTEKSLRATLERNGLKVTRLQGINTDFITTWSIRNRIIRLAARVLGLATFGYFSDIRHLQLAFQATPVGV